MRSDFKLKVIRIEKDKFFFRSNYAWKICLSADDEYDLHTYSLPFNQLNFLKLRKIDPQYFNLERGGGLRFPRPLEIKKLRPYQQEDINLLSKLNAVAIFNEMRTGKTPTSLMLSVAWRVTNLIIVVPPVLQGQWQKAVEDWVGFPAYVISQLPKTERMTFYEKFCFTKNLAVIISKDVFKTDNNYFKNLRKKAGMRILPFCVIVDEAHYLRNYKSQQSKSIYTLEDSCYKIVLTGTPFVNSYADIFGILKFLKPSEYKSYWKFAELFFNIQSTDFLKSGRKIFLREVGNFKSRRSEIQLKNEIASFSTSRKQREVLPWLPPIIHQRETLIMNEEQNSLYAEWSKLRDYSPELLANLKSITLYPRHVLAGIKTNGVKIDYIVNFCFDNQNKSILIFSTRSNTFLVPLSNLLKERKLTFALITGSISQVQREASIQAFQISRVRILLCNIQSAGLGLNFQQADTIIFADRSYSPADNDQAEARFLPTDQFQKEKIKLIIDLVCKSTVDERILKLLARKKNITSVIKSEPELVFRNEISKNGGV